MIKNYKGFQEVAEARFTQLNEIKEAFLSEAGLEVRRLYAQIIEDFAYAETAGQLLRFIEAGPGYGLKTAAGAEELRIIASRLRKLAAAGD